MNRSATSVLLVLLGLMLLDQGGQPAAGQTPRREPMPGAGVPRKALGALLNQAIETKDFLAPMTIKEALDRLGGWIANFVADSPLFIDEEAFLAEEPNARDLLSTEIRFPSLPRKMTIGACLRAILGKVPGHNATFLLRNGMLEITTVKAASPKQLLRQRVVANFQNLPLDEAIDELSEQTGLSVIVDARAGDKKRAPVTAALGNDVTLEAALRLLADMADLKLVVMADAVYVTTPANAPLLCKAPRQADPQSPSK
jgi:hypothetical protein